MSALLRLQKPLHQHIDPESQISITALIAMSLDAICDKTQSSATYDEGIKMLTDGLYEIQRGENIDDKGADNGLKDSPICPPGAFNKIIEKLL